MMPVYVTEADVDELAGTEWRNGSDSARAVMIANVWLRNRGVEVLNPMPSEIKNAGAELVKLAAAGALFADKQKGLLSESVAADSVRISQTFDGKAETVSAQMQLIETLIRPFVSDGMAAGEARVIGLLRM